MSLPSDPHTGNGLKGTTAPPSQQLSLPDIWRMVCRRKWLLILPCIAIALGGAVLCYYLPNIYRATTVILVEAQRVPEAYVQSIVSTSVQDRLRTITQQIKSYTRLEEVIRSVRLMDNLQDRKAVDEYIERMREKIEVNVKGNDAFTISYSDKSPRVVQQVTNKLASLFIGENIKVREQYVTGTTDFLESELSRVRDLLEIQEKKINEFRQKYTGELPDQQDANLRTLDRLQLQSQTNQASIHDAQRRKNLLVQQLRSTQQSPQIVLESNPSIPAEVIALKKRLAEQKQTLNQLQAKKKLFSVTYLVVNDVPKKPVVSVT
jgi:capsular polysaccharide biosynthesis protein